MLENETKVDARCPHCNRKHELATCVDADATPKDGDFSLCIKCGEWAIFDHKSPGHLRSPTVDEYLHIGQSETMRKTRAAWVTMKEKIDKKPEPPPKPKPKKPTPLQDGFDALMKDVYGGHRGPIPDKVYKEFRRHFFFGALVAVQHIAEAMEDMNVVDMLKRYNDVVDEARAFKADLSAGEA